MRVDQNSKKKILIGFLSKTIKGSIPTITSVFVEGLSGSYDVVPFYMERKMGKKSLAALNILNVYYFAKHFLLWSYAVIRHKPDIVHFPVTSYWNMEKSLIFLATAKRLGVKSAIGHLHGGAFIEFWKNLNRFRKAHALKLMGKLDVLIVLSDTWKRNVVSHLGLNEEKVIVLHNLIDTEFEGHFKLYRRDYNDSQMVTLMGFNLMDSRKGLFDLIEATALLDVNKDFEIVIIGDEREYGVISKAKELIESKQLLNIKLLPGLWGDEKIKWFERADVLVLPSHTENFPVVVLEAASAGLPVIATSIGALPDIFKHNDDILFIDSGDIDYLARYLTLLINHPDERKRLGESIKMTFDERLAGEIVINKLREIYSRIN